MSAIVLPADQSFGQGISQFGSTLGNVLYDKGIRQREQQQHLSQLGALGQAFEAINPEQTVPEQISTLMQTLQQSKVPFKPEQVMDSLKTFGSLTEPRERLKQMYELDRAREESRIRSDERKDDLKEKSEIRKEQIKSQFGSPEIKKYRENLGLREETATALRPALENARQYRNSPSRFIKGSAARKSLGDLAIRGFAFYKPLFGGRLTQKEFVNSIENLASDKAFPGGFDQAMNILDSMITQSTKEADLFANYLEEGKTPYQARRDTLKSMRDNADEILDILKGSKKKSQEKENTIEMIAPDGRLLDVPRNEVIKYQNLGAKLK